MKKLATLLILTLPLNAFALANYADKLVCDLGYELTSDKGRTLVDDLIDLSTLDDEHGELSEASVWPNKSQKTTHNESRGETCPYS